mgnify:CR=1 FL=1
MMIGIKVTADELNVWVRLVADFFDRHGRDPDDRETRCMVTAAKMIAEMSGGSLALPDGRGADPRRATPCPPQ